MILIAGPCQAESKTHLIESAGFLNELTKQYDVDFYFKTSFDKANRTSLHSPRGAGIDCLIDAFSVIQSDGIKTLTDIHEPHQANYIQEFVDVVQIPALLSRQTDLLKMAGSIYSKVNIKKGQFMSPSDIKYAREKVKSAGCEEVWLTERGSTFGYNNLVVDFRSLLIMKEENPDAKIIFDCTHSCQLPSANNGKSSGDRRYALPLSKAASAVGVDGLFLETHEDPDSAPSDGPNMIPHSELPRFLDELCDKIRR